MMNRRALLASTGIALSWSLAGCVSNSGDPDDSSGADDGDADSVPVLTGHEVSDHAVTPDVEHAPDMDSWGLFLATRDAADRYFGDVDGSGADEVRTFVDETSFESGDRLLYVHSFAPQTCYELVLDDQPRVAENGLPLVKTELDRLAPADHGCGDAVTPVRLLLRLSFDLDGGSTDVVEVHVSGRADGTEELLVETER